METNTINRNKIEIINPITLCFFPGSFLKEENIAQSIPKIARNMLAIIICCGRVMLVALPPLKPSSNNFKEIAKHGYENSPNNIDKMPNLFSFHSFFQSIAFHSHEFVPFRYATNKRNASERARPAFQMFLFFSLLTTPATRP
jgi:hypothetical protein